MGARYSDPALVIVLHGSRLHMIENGRVAKIAEENVAKSEPQRSWKF
jgi:hypothetical protein